jgi:hypothetical protein
MEAEQVSTSSDAVLVSSRPARTGGFVTLAELQRRSQQNPTNYLVDSLLPAESVNVGVGDSGIGKTALAYQLGLSVATGTPFLGYRVNRGPVLYYDMENNQEDIIRAGSALCRHIGTPPFPDDFLVLPDDCQTVRLEEAMADHHPALVIIDTLRAYRPTATKTNEDTGQFLQEVKRAIQENPCAVFLLHHTRKAGNNPVPALEDTPTGEWLEQASGARALVNLTNTRFAFAAPDGRRGYADETALIMKLMVKVRGESAPFYLKRVLDADGEPLGYERLTGLSLISNPAIGQAYRDLPHQFRFSEAKRAFNLTDDPTNKWLAKLAAVGVLEKAGRGLYRKIDPVESVESIENLPIPIAA